MRCPRCGEVLESKTKLCPNCTRVRVSDIESTSTDSRYTDLLKPRSTVRVKGVGSRMAGHTTVESIRHEITSGESSPSPSIRCRKCGAAIELKDIVCRACGARL